MSLQTLSFEMDLLFRSVVIKAFPLPPHLSYVQRTPLNNSSPYTLVTEMLWWADMTWQALSPDFPFPPPLALPVAWSWGPLEVSAPKLTHLHLPTHSYQLLKTLLSCFKFPRTWKGSHFPFRHWACSDYVFHSQFSGEEWLPTLIAQNWPCSLL